MPSIGFDRAAEYYDSTRGFAPGVAERIRDAIVTYTHAGAQAHFLDLGVGTGRIALPFIRAGYDVTGVDLAQAMMDRLERKLAADANRQDYRYRLVRADVCDLPFPDESFDVAIAVHVLHLVDNWRQALDEARRVVRRPGGWLLIAADEPAEDGGQSADRLVNAQWDAILHELGHSRDRLLPGVDILPAGARESHRARSDAGIEAYLRERGAQTEVVCLADHPTLPLAPRAMAQRHIERQYANDWQLPDAIHYEAVRRLQAWLDTQCPEPDRAITATNQFSAIAAHW